ncbi:hypothetical protein AA313_de0208459 [Arthrobotrys entomopaga]|nr:hypothetical protein AA313_de0208459 [Arthrobotrys entomopaga]
MSFFKKKKGDDYWKEMTKLIERSNAIEAQHHWCEHSVPYHKKCEACPRHPSEIHFPDAPVGQQKFNYAPPCEFGKDTCGMEHQSLPDIFYSHDIQNTIEKRPQSELLDHKTKYEHEIPKPAHQQLKQSTASHPPQEQPKYGHSETTTAINRRPPREEKDPYKRSSEFGFYDAAPASQKSENTNQFSESSSFVQDYTYEMKPRSGETYEPSESSGFASRISYPRDRRKRYSKNDDYHNFPLSRVSEASNSSYKYNETYEPSETSGFGSQYSFWNPKVETGSSYPRQTSNRTYESSKEKRNTSPTNNSPSQRLRNARETIGAPPPEVLVSTRPGPALKPETPNSAVGSSHHRIIRFCKKINFSNVQRHTTVCTRLSTARGKDDPSKDHRPIKTYY